MHEVVQISKKNGVSIGAHPSFNDPENFGRERMNLSTHEIKKLIMINMKFYKKLLMNMVKMLLILNLMVL